MRFNKKTVFPHIPDAGRRFFAHMRIFKNSKGLKKTVFNSPFLRNTSFREKVKLVRTGKINNAVKYSRKVIKAFTFHL